MRALLVSMLLAAAPAAAESAHDAPTGSANIDVTELTISAGGGSVRRSCGALDDVVDAAARCYDSVKSKPEKLRATVTLKFRIDDHGAVSTASPPACRA